MRVFYALTFEEADKKKMVAYRDMLADKAIKGRFTRWENFHLTLAFIGEVSPSKLTELIDILYETAEDGRANDLDGHEPDDHHKNNTISLSASVRASYIGSFRRREREILWLGIDRNKELKQLEKKLAARLRSEGYAIEQRKYTPHITLGRQVLLEESVSDMMIEPKVLPVRSIALMESKRVGDVLVYEPIEEVFVS